MTSTRLAAGILAAASVAGLQGCCFDACNASAASAADATPVRRLRIVDWGPRDGRAGIPFNAQPGGRAALWIRLDRGIDGRTALVQFDDAYLEAQVAGNLVTAMVPGESYARPGVYAVRVVATAGDGTRWSSDRVSFTARQPPAPRIVAARLQSRPLPRRHPPAP